MKHFLYHLFGLHVFELKGDCPSNYVLACKCGACKALTPKQIGEIEDRKQIAKLIEDYYDHNYQAFFGQEGEWRVVYADGGVSKLMPKHVAIDYSMIFKSKGIVKTHGKDKGEVILTKK